MSENVVAIRSKDSIVRAMFALMERDAYEKLSVSEIAAEADLDRRTFYRHFKNKDEIIKYYLKTCARLYEAEFIKYPVHDNFAIAEAFFTSCGSQKTELTVLLKHNLSHLLLAEIGSMFATFQQKFASQEELERTNREFMLAYHIGGFWNIMNQWLSGGCRQPPVEMAMIIKQMMDVKQI